jgi:competence protein ComEA
MDRLLPWLRRSGWVYGLIALVLAVMAWRSMGGGGDEGSTAPAARVVRRPDVPKMTLVHVAGAVRTPGVYRMGGDSRVIQAVRMAGGPTARADLSRLNLAAPLADGQQVVIPERPRRGSPGAGASAAAGAPGGGPVSLSSATAADLEALDGVGPALAARIVAWRDSNGGFSSVDQLDEVPGIGPARMEALRPLLVP